MKPRVFALAALLTGCDPLPDWCQSCLNGDPTLAVPTGEVSKIGMVYSGQKLPPSAINIYYHESGGPDFQQWIRFDAPLADARAFADSQLLAPLAKVSIQPPQSQQFVAPSKPMPWWPITFPTGVETGSNGIDQANYNEGQKGKPMTIILQSGSPNARVWIYAFSM